MNILGLIPSRYASARFPAKPLALVRGKTMIQRVVEQAQQTQSLSRVVVATDDDRIRDHVIAFGGEVVMTGTHHQSGTDRCQEALEQLGGSYDYVVNIQGDEPFMHPEQIDLLTSVLNGTVELATLVKRITDVKMVQNPNTIKVVLNGQNEALYFSRQPIPYPRDLVLSDRPVEQWPQHQLYYKHIGLYAYRTDVLAQITQLPVSSLERTESLEQLRWLENGYRIKVVETSLESHSIDTPEDLLLL